MVGGADLPGRKRQSQRQVHIGQPGGGVHLWLGRVDPGSGRFKGRPANRLRKGGRLVARGADLELFLKTDGIVYPLPGRGCG